MASKGERPWRRLDK